MREVWVVHGRSSLPLLGKGKMKKLALTMLPDNWHTRSKRSDLQTRRLLRTVCRGDGREGHQSRMIDGSLRRCLHILGQSFLQLFR